MDKISSEQLYSVFFYLIRIIQQFCEAQAESDYPVTLVTVSVLASWAQPAVGNKTEMIDRLSEMAFIFSASQ